MAGNENCKNVKHVFHICALKDCGISESGKNGFGKLIDRPKFKCEKCGQKANGADNLCNPKQI